MGYIGGVVEGKRGRGRPRVTWTDDIKVWTGDNKGKKGQGKTKSHVDRRRRGILEGLVEGKRGRGRQTTSECRHPTL